MDFRMIRAGTQSSSRALARHRSVRPLAALCAAGVLIAGAVSACGDDNDSTNTTTGTAANLPGGGAGSGGSAGAAGSTGSTSAAGSGGTRGGSTSGSNGNTAGNGRATGGAGGSTSAGTALGGAAGLGGPQNRAQNAADAGTILALDGGVAPDAGLAQEARALTDGEIAFAADTLNAGEVDQARAALPRLTRQDVQAFARQMIDDHQNARDQLLQLEDSQSIAPALSDFSNNLKRDSDQVIAGLLRAPASSVDALYINSQVTAHGLALQSLDGFIAGAQNEALKALLTELRSTVQAHLTAARTLQRASAPSGDQ